MKAHRLPFSMMAFAFLLLCGCSGPAPPGGPNFTATQPDLGGAPRTLTNAWADFDSDGDTDLSLTGATDSGMHHILSNQMPQTLEARSILVQVTDGNGFRTRAGAEVRVYEAGTRTLLGTRLLDTGSGYNTQSSLPVHFGLPREGLVDIEVIFPGGGSRSVTAVKNVDPRDHAGRPVTVTLSE